MEELHILQMLKAQKRRHLSFHTPGHKKRGEDITELSYSDNLYEPKGILAQVEREISEIVGAKASFLLTDGSTSGVFSMLYALKKSGARSFACPKFSHPSVFHAAEVLDLEMVLLKQSAEYGLFEPISLKELERGIQNSDALLLTSPDYYGFFPPLQEARRLCNESGKPLLLDGAHGSHLHFTDLYAGNFADLWVDGAHKSLPARTQGALVSAKSSKWTSFLREGVRRFRTSSPSYPILESVEYAFKYPRNFKIEQLSEQFKLRNGCVKNEDWTKILVPFGKECDHAQEFLERHGVYPEFNDGNYLLFYLSPCTKQRELIVLERLLKKIPRGRVEKETPCGQIPMYEGENR